jgi:hypothetical protein
LFRAQPLAALNGLCGGDQEALTRGIRIIADLLPRATPLDAIPDDALLAWCDNDPVYRYPAIANVITIASPAKDGEPPQWSSIACGLLARAPDQIQVLKLFIRQFTPLVWNGSRASHLESNVRLLDSVPTAQPATLDFIEQERAKWAHIVEEERRRETNMDRAMDARFE